MIKVPLPIRVVTRGKITLGPKPGTPEFEEEQRKKAEAHGDVERGSEERRS